MPIILVKDRIRSGNQNKEEIDVITEVAKEVFGESGILPMPEGAVRIVPGFVFVEPCKLSDGLHLEIYLHKKPEREGKEEEIKKAFRKAFDDRLFLCKGISVNLQLENLWQTF